MPIVGAAGIVGSIFCRRKRDATAGALTGRDIRAIAAATGMRQGARRV